MAGFTLTLTSQLPYLQQTDLTNQGFYPRDSDRRTGSPDVFAQQLAESAGVRSSSLYPTARFNPTPPGKDQRKGTVLSFDENGEPVAGPNIGAVFCVAGDIAAINTVAR